MEKKVIRRAVISSDKRYRYLLEREWDERPPLAVCMYNPSKADAERDDPTITRLIHRAQPNYGGLLVVNLFPYRTTYPVELFHALTRMEDIQQRAENFAFIQRAIFGKDVLLAWGNLPPIAPEQTVIQMCYEYAARVLCLEIGKRGYPKHPLYIAYSVEMKPYTGRFAICR